MKKFCILPLVAALAFFVSCQKQQSEEEKKAEVERQVQERLAVEHQAEEKQRLAQQQADLEAREKALAKKEAAAAKVPAEAPIKAPPSGPRPHDTSETRSTGSYGMFYRKLEPYGAWRESSDYGYVWQPHQAEESRDWRPYADGRWVYTDAGCTWVSEEPFGWATYHYGRWVRLRRIGWVWVPGDEWAPAWVSWRTSNEYVGWAPLPPEARFERRSGIHNWADNYYDIGPDQYTFVPVNEFGSRRIRLSVVPIERNISIVIETTNVTNITYTNTTIINQGPNYEEMRSRSREPMQRYRLERQANSEVTAPAIVRGDVLVVSAPINTAIRGVDRPPTVKEGLLQTPIEKNWTAITDHDATDRARAKMKVEATPPPDAPSKKFVKPEPSSTAPTTPISAISTPGPTVAMTPPAISSATPAISESPMPAPTAQATATAISTPSALASPTARPQPLVPFPKPTPRHILPPPMTPPTDPVKKPMPRSSPAPRPLIPPPVKQPPAILVPPPGSEEKPTPQSQADETKPAVRQTPPDVERKQPVAAPATSEPNIEPSPSPKHPTEKPKGVQGPGKMEDTEPMPIPAPTPPAVQK